MPSEKLRRHVTRRRIWIKAVRHPDNIFYNFEHNLSTFKFEADKKYSRRQFILRSKGWACFNGYVKPAPNCIKDFHDLQCDSGQSGLTLQLFPVETIVTSILIGQNNTIDQWKNFIQVGADWQESPA